MEDDFLFYLETLDYTNQLNTMVKDRLEYLTMFAWHAIECFDLITRDISFQLTSLGQQDFFLTDINFHDRTSIVLTTQLRIEGDVGRVHRSPRLFKDHRANEWHRCRIQQQGR